MRRYRPKPNRNVELVVSDIDAFWAQQFANAGLTYTSPNLRAVDGPLETACGTIDLVVSDIDAFWAEQFANAGLTYTSPNLRSIDGPMTTSCGEIDASFSPGAYCAADQTVY